MRRAVEQCIALLAAAAFVWPLAAQDSDAPRAPRILDTPSAAAPQAAPAETPAERAVPSIVRRPPNAARLAPLPQQRIEQPEEIVVIGQSWRLPDLGSEWRARQKELANQGRFSMTVFPLYDPAEPPLHADAFLSRERRRHGYIELFRFGFGRRSRD